MSESCSIIGHCRDRKTKKLTSKLSQLHRDLLDLGKNNKFFDRRKANKAFFLSQSDKFLEEYDSELIFDSDAADAEPIIASLFEVIHSAIPEVTYGEVRDLLAKKFEEGVYSYSEAIDKMKSFNKEMQGAHTFMGTVKRQADGRYKFEIVYNAIEEQEALMQTIADRNFENIIIKKLERLGIHLEEDSTIAKTSMFFGKIVEGIHGIVKIKQGENITSDLANVTGFTIIKALGEDNALIKRLLTLADGNPQVIIDLYPSILTEMQEELGISDLNELSEDRRAQELAARLLGKHLMDAKNIKNVGIGKGIKRLLNRILDYVKTKFAITDRDLKQAQYDAKYLAYRTVKDFLGENFQGSLGITLKQRSSEQLSSKLGDLLKRLDILRDRAKDWGHDTAKAFDDKFSDILTSYNEINRQIKESIGKEALTDADLHAEITKQLVKATRFIVNQIREAQSQLVIVQSGINPLSGEPLKDNECCKIIRMNELLYTEARRLLDEEFDQIREVLVGEDDIKRELLEVQESLREVLYGVRTEYAAAKDLDTESYNGLIQAAKRKYAVKLLSKINGNQFLVMEQYVSFDGFLKIKRHSNTIINLKEELLDASKDPPMDTFSRWITSMADSPSIINTLMHIAVEEKRHEANLKTLKAKDKLYDLYQKLRKYGISSTSIFMEKDSQGGYTGNIISERNWGQWELNRKKDYKEWFNSWWEANHGLFNNVREAYNDAIFLEAKGAFLQSWHKKNSTHIETEELDEEGNPIKRWVPAISSDEGSEGKTLYAGEQFNKLKSSTDKKDQLAIKWLEEYMQLKKELDALLPEGATNSYGVRAPQFQGTFVNKLRGAFGGKYTAGEHIKRVGGVTIGSFILQRLGENPSDTEYGGEHNTYDDDDLLEGEELLFSRAHYNAVNSYRRVPIYGVKKFKDPYKVSTDLIHSTLAYASMAYNYECLESIIDEVEVLKESLKKQRVGSDYSVGELQAMGGKSTPGVYGRMVDYVEQQVYNVYCPTKHRKLYKTMHKVLGLTTRYGSLYFLQFNIHSAITNAFTGFWELFKEAIGNEDFGQKEFWWTIGLYIGYWFTATANNFGRFAMGFKDGYKGSDLESRDRMTLFLKEFDAENDNQREFRDYHIQTPGYQLTKGYSYANIAMLPYSFTDRWMQAVAYIATAKHTKLRNKEGVECSVWDAYTVKDGKLVLKTASDGSDAEWKILDKNQKGLMDILHNDIMNDTVSDVLAKAVYKTNDDGSLMFDEEGNKILKDIYVPWDIKTQTLFKTNCRGINNRLHGVYNSNDGGAYLGKILGPAFASLKKYAIGLIDRRFTRSRYDARAKKHRQGSTVTIANLTADYMFTFDKNTLIHMSDREAAMFKLCKRAANAVLGLGQVLCIVSFAGAGTANILRRRGYSENQIANIRRFWADNMVPEFLRFLLYIVAPPDELDDDKGSLLVKGLLATGALKEREIKEYDDEPWLPKVSDALLSGYIECLKAQKWLFNAAPILGLPKELTTSDADILTKDYFYYQAGQYTKDIPFSVKGILTYQLYRLLLEQEAYRIGSPTSLYSLYSEYKNLTNSSLMNLSALYDTVNLLGQLYEHKTVEELDALAQKKGETIYKKYTDDGQELYTKGINNYFRKGAMHAIKISPFRTGAMWVYGHQSKRSQAFWRSRALGLEEPKD